MNDLTRPPAPRQELSHSYLAHPPRTDRPGIRWWWQSPTPVAELIEELHAIADAGFGEVEIAFSPEFWASEEQREALAAVLEQARSLDIGVSMTLGAAWPLQTPNTARGTRFAAQELQYGATWIEADGNPVTVPVPLPFDDPQGERPSQLVAVVAAAVLERGSGPRVVDSGNPWGKPTKIIEPERSTLLDQSTLTVLTGSLADHSSNAAAGRAGQADRAVTWTPQPGAWVVTAFWMRDTEQGVTSFVDAHAARAALEYLDKHQIGAAGSQLDAPDSCASELFEDSLELNADCLFWSPTMLERFREHLGYDLTPYLPLVMAHGQCRYWVPEVAPRPDFESALPARAQGASEGEPLTVQVHVTDLGARVRSDFDRLVTDLYTSDHLALIQDWAAGHGMRHKAQAAYGQNLEAVRSFRELVRCGGRAEVESLNSGDRVPMSSTNPTWRFSVDWQRSAVAGAHQGGAVRVSTELGAQMDKCYDFSLTDYRHMLDKEWALGVTKPFVHGFAAQAPDAPWPTQGRFGTIVSESWNHRHFPQWEQWRALTDYWARGTAFLETGTPRTDVAVYRDGFLTTAARGNAEADATAPDRLIDAEPLERAGYGVQIIDPVALSEPGIVGDIGWADKRECVLFPQGPAYRALIIASETLTPQAAWGLIRAGEAGLAIVFVGSLPFRDAGWGGRDRSQEIADAVARLVRMARTRQVAGWEEIPGVLHDLGVWPRVGWSVEPGSASSAPALLSQVRDAADGRYALMYNPSSDHSAEVDLNFELSARASDSGWVLDLFDMDTTSCTSVCVNTDGDYATVPLELDPLGIAFVRLRSSSQGEELPVVSSVRAAGCGVGHGLKNPREATDIRISWEELTVRTEEATGSRVIHLPRQGPGDWRDIKELAQVSGTGTYRAILSGPGGQALTVQQCEGLSVLLARGSQELGGVVRVHVAGRDCGTVTRAGQRVNIGCAVAAACADGEPAILELEVRTTLRNATLAADAYMRGPWAVDHPSRPHGLIWPVILERD